MRAFRLTVLSVVLLALAGCASGGGSPASTGNTAVPANSSGSPTGGASSPGLPVPAPSDSDGLQVSGPVTVRLLSRTGPVQPAGPYVGSSVADLVARYRTALGGHQPQCAPASCWSDAKVPAASVLIAVRPALVACYQVQRITTATTAVANIRLDLQLNYVCRAGMGAAARMPALLLAVPGDYAVGGKLTVTVRVSQQPGSAFTQLGTASL